MPQLETRYPITTPTVRDIRDDFERLFTRHRDTCDRFDENHDIMLELTGVSFEATEPYILGEPDLGYITREVAWYDSMSLNVNDIPNGPPAIWKQVADKDGIINSNYGYLVYGDENGNQFANVDDELRRDKYSRRAVMVYTRPSIHDDAVENDRNDFICTNTVQYLIRDDKLEAIVQMRSNDAVFGYRNDYAWQRILQGRLLTSLRRGYPELRMGKMIWQVGSLHIYPRHIPLLADAIDSGNWYVSTR